MEFLEIYNEGLDVAKITNRWTQNFMKKNFGAIITFVGVVRDENGICALSFDIYEPLLRRWFEGWQSVAKSRRAVILMAHSKGNVAIYESSFIAAVISPKRRVGLDLIDEFVEDFKANAPIWKYDVKNGEKIWAKNRSKMLKNAGILS